MDAKAVKGILIGYDDCGYRIWCRESNKLIRSRDVTFREEALQSSSVRINQELAGEHKEDKAVEPPINHDEIEEVDENKEGEEQDHLDENGDGENYKESEEQDHLDENGDGENYKAKLRDRSKLKIPIRYEDYILSAESNISEYYEPETYREAADCKDASEWQLAMENEIKSLKENNTWILEDLPPGRTAIPCKWVFKIKTHADGSIDKYKARLVIKGFSQRKGVDYNQTFSPVARSGTIRTVLSVAANEGMYLSQVDVSTAFLYGYLEESIFMKQPEGFEDGTNQVCRLMRSLYGLKQAPRCWNIRFTDYLFKIGFKRCEADPCLFIRHKDGNKLIMALYVDDGLIAGTVKEDVDQFIGELKKEFKITAKSASYFLGIEIERFENGDISICQTSYAKKVLERFGMSDSKPVSTPILKEGIQDDLGKEDSDFPYRQAVGALMYLMCCTRPDLAFAVGVASRNLDKHTREDVMKVKRIFRYLRGTLNYRILYKNKYNEGIVESYSDADHGGDLTTGRSTTGVLCLYSAGAVSWLSQRQPSVSISTTEAEVVAASEAAREVVWLKRLLSEITTLTCIPTLKIDNEAAVKLSENPEYHRRTKHIRIRHFFVRELVNEGEIKVQNIRTDFQLADCLTKPLPYPRLKNLCTGMGLDKKQVEGEC